MSRSTGRGGRAAARLLLSGSPADAVWWPPRSLSGCLDPGHRSDKPPTNHPKPPHRSPTSSPVGQAPPSRQTPTTASPPPRQTSGAARLLGPGAGYATPNGSRPVRHCNTNWRWPEITRTHGRAIWSVDRSGRDHFQTTHGLPADRDRRTTNHRGATGRTPALAPGAGYRSASGSSAVRVLQRRLARHGFDPGPIDGRYGHRRCAPSPASNTLTT